jgi:hypothetical protein
MSIQDRLSEIHGVETDIEKAVRDGNNARAASLAVNLKDLADRLFNELYLVAFKSGSVS